MTLRSTKERICQTAVFEVGGILIAAPLYTLFFATSSGHSLFLLVCLSAVVLIWAPLHNTAFDRFDLSVFGRTACARPHKWRIVHATSLEVTSVALTLPVVMVVSHHGVWEALAVNVGLTVFYAIYGYVFHVIYDWCRPLEERDWTVPTRPEAGCV